MNDSWAISRLVLQIKQNWRRGGQSPDAEAALQANPHLRRWKGVVLDLACEEYQLRASDGHAPNAVDFCRRFPDYQRSLLHRLEVEQYLRREEEQQALPWPQPGERFLGYRLIESLGKGALGRVFLAEQIEMRDRRVVVKVTPGGQREAHTLALLSHPHIVPVYRYDEAPSTGLAAICMPFLSRTTLEDFLMAAQAGDAPPDDFPAVLAALEERHPHDELTETPVQSDERRWRPYIEGVLNLGRQIAEALAHTHQRGVLHLDLKPSNVLVLADGRPMLLDFNLSLEGAVGAGVIGGTLPYMSPEQLQEAVLGRSYSSRPVDGRSDVFSLGVMLYELLAGAHPFGEIPRCSDPREAAKELLRRHRQGPAAWDASRTSVDREVIRFLDACLAFHPDQRPQTAAEAAAALRGFLTSRARFRRWRQKHRRRSLIAAAGMLLAGAVALGAAWAIVPPKHERLFRAAQVYLERGETAPAQDALMKAVELHDQSPALWEALGNVYRDQGKYEEAYQCFARAYKLFRDPRFCAEMGHCKYLARDFGMAQGWYKKSLNDGHESELLYLNLADCYCYDNIPDYAAVGKCYDRLVELNPQSPVPYALRIANELAWSRNDVSHPMSPEIAADARRIAELAPDDPKSLFEAADALAALPSSEENDRAIRDYLQRACKHTEFNHSRLFTPHLTRFRGQIWFDQLLPGRSPSE